MPNFPAIKNKSEFSNLLLETHDGLEKKGKWLTQDVKLIKKSPRYICLIKRILNIFSGDRFQKIRTHCVAQGLAELCSQNKQWIDPQISKEACVILDLLKTKTSASRKKTLYAQEIEKAKEQIRALVVDSTLQTTTTTPPPHIIDKVYLSKSKDEKETRSQRSLLCALRL